MKENCGKIENILNLALDATREEREKSLNLDVGYDVADDSWEVIVKFFGTTEELRQKLSERFPEEQAQIGIYNPTQIICYFKDSAAVGRACRIHA